MHRQRRDLEPRRQPRRRRRGRGGHAAGGPRPAPPALQDAAPRLRRDGRRFDRPPRRRRAPLEQPVEHLLDDVPPDRALPAPLLPAGLPGVPRPAQAPARSAAAVPPARRPRRGGHGGVGLHALHLRRVRALLRAFADDPGAAEGRAHARRPRSRDDRDRLPADPAAAGGGS